MNNFFPFFKLNFLELNRLMKPPVSTNPRKSVGTPIGVVPKSKSNCFACKKPVPRNNYKNKTIIYIQ